MASPRSGKLVIGRNDSCGRLSWPNQPTSLTGSSIANQTTDAKILLVKVCVCGKIYVEIEIFIMYHEFAVKLSII